MNYPTLLLINGLTWILVLAEYFFPTGLIRFGLGIPFLLFFPGYSLLVPVRIGAIQRVALSVGLSMLLVTLLGFGLNYTPWGITLDSVTYAVALLITATSIFAAVRQPKAPKTPKIESGSKDPLINNSPRRLTLTIVAIATIIGTGLTSAYFLFTDKYEESFTSFSIASSPVGNTVFPNNLVVGETLNVFVAVTNHEGSNHNYSVEVIINGKISSLSPEITLANGETWQQSFPISFASSGKAEKVEFGLFKDDQPYLTPLYVWFDITTV